MCRNNIGESATLTIQCLNWRCSGSALDGASGSTITSVYDTSFARSSPSPVLSAFAKGRFIGVTTMSGSSRVSSLSKVFPVVTSQPAGYTTENRRMGVKVEGRTSGTISARLRARTIESSGDVIVQVQPMAEVDTHPTLSGCGRSPGRGGPAVLRSSDPVVVSHDPQNDLNMTSGKKAETKVATLKGQEGSKVF